MKEFLRKDIDNKYIIDTAEDAEFLEPHAKDWIKIPDGADKYIQGVKYKDRFGFLKGDLFWDNEWINHCDKPHEYNILWKRDSVEGEKEDCVNSPSHYNKGGVECIDAIESSMTKEAFCGYLKGNVIKYMYRYENKGGVESLKKAQWYLSKLINLESV